MKKNKKKTNTRKKKKQLKARRRNARRKKNKLLKQQLKDKERLLEIKRKKAERAKRRREERDNESLLDMLFGPSHLDEFFEIGMERPSPFKPKSEEEKFFDDMHRYAGESRTKAKFVPFESYYLDYEQLSKKQLDYYFYWRGEAREGNYIEQVGNSNYVLLYFIELLNMIGSGLPDKLLPKLIEVNDVLMAKDQEEDSVSPETQALVATNIFDFAFFHDLDLKTLPVDILENMKSEERLIMAIDAYLDVPTKEIPIELLVSIADFDFYGKSALYQDDPVRMESIIKDVFTLLDEYRGETLLKSMTINKFSNMPFHAFPNYFVEKNTYNRNKRTVTFLDVPALKNYVTAVFQQTENLVRDLYGYKGRYRKYQLEDTDELDLIGEFLLDKYQPNQKLPETPETKETKVNVEGYLEERKEKSRIKINPERVEKLREDTETVQKLLDTEETKEVDPLSYVDDLVNALSRLVQSNPEYKHIIESDYLASTELPVEEINTEAMRYLNAPLIVEGAINEKYKPGIDYIREHIADYPFLTESVSEDSSVISELLETLTPGQKETVRLIANGETSELMQVALSEMSTPELLIDDINSTALLYLDDILIEMDETGENVILSEYLDEVKNAFNME